MASNAPHSALPPESVIFGQSACMQAVRQKIQKIVNTHIPVLIQGESGTGKEVVAQYLHSKSGAMGPLVKVNCPAIPATLLESELFGYEKGAFTGAYQVKPGRVELANKGTLFLDEIGELDMGIQAKLLQLLQDGHFTRIGAHEEKRVELRFICATNRSLEQEIANKTFRRDLFYRINVISIKLPPLRERLEDIPGLCAYFVQYYNQRFGRQTPPLSLEAIRRLLDYRWPGNIRELENLAKRYVILGSEEETLGSDFLGETADDRIPDIPINGSISLKKLTREAVQALERQIILKVLHANHWNRKLTAQALNISYRALLYKIKNVTLPPHIPPMPHTDSERASAEPAE